MEITQSNDPDLDTYTLNQKIHKVFKVLENDQWLGDKKDFNPSDYYVLPPRKMILFSKCLVEAVAEIGIEDPFSVVQETILEDIAALPFTTNGSTFDLVTEWQLDDGNTFEFSYTLCFKPECIIAYKDFDLATG